MIATARDGATIDYTLHAAPGAPRLVLVHSLGLDRRVWDAVVERLRGRVEMLAYDCRGHGASAKPPGPYSTELFAADLRDVLAAAGWSRAFVAGASMGGSVTLEFAAAYPALVEGLGLIDTTAWYGADAPAQWAERANKARTEGLGSMIAFQLTRWFSDGYRAAHPDVLERCQATFLANDVVAYGAACGMLGSFDVRPMLPAIGVPVEILVGEDDYATPVAMAEELHVSIPGAHLRVVPGARHLTMIEAPDEVAGTIERLLATKGTRLANQR